MKVVDAFTGRVVINGEPVPLPEGGYWILLDVSAGLLTATLTYAVVQQLPICDLEPFDPQVKSLVMPVRYMHPKYPFQRVVFFPS